jgi:hypothetical protein
MTVEELRVRVRRLGELGGRFARELARVRQCNGPLLPSEREAYSSALLEARGWIEAARVLLDLVVKRVEIEEGWPAPDVTIDLGPED